jgi:hypothetical protein
MYTIEYKTDELGSWKVFEQYDTIEDAIEASGELLYDGYIVRISEGE